MQDGFRIWEGVVEDRNDPLDIGRCRVRVFGLHTEDKSKIPTESLPWAIPMQGITSAAMSGIGETPVGVVEGTVVAIYFRDPGEYQHPVMMGTFGGIPAAKPDKNKGFSDPTGKYPNKVGEPDTNRLARGQTAGTTIADQNSTVATDIPHPTGAPPDKVMGSWNEPKSPFKAKYPFNKVVQTESGHVVEMDDSPDGERIRIWHRTGSMTEIHPDGTQVHRVTKDDYVVVSGDRKAVVKGEFDLTVVDDSNVSIAGNANILVAQSANISVLKDVSLDVYGDLDAYVAGNTKLDSTGNVQVSSQEIMLMAFTALKIKSLGAIQIDGTAIQIAAPTVQIMSPAFSQVTSYSPIVPPLTPVIKTPGAFIIGEDGALPPLPAPVNGLPVYLDAPLSAGEKAALAALGVPTEPADYTPNPSQTDFEIPASPFVLPVTCTAFTDPTDPTNQLSTNLTLANLILENSVVAQGGLSVEEIVCNMERLAKNLLEPIIAQYGMPVFTSGFRYGSNTSFHNMGCAVDMQWPGITDEEYYTRCKWIKDNLPFAELILEYGGNRPWIHAAYNETEGDSRYPKTNTTREVFTRVKVPKTYSVGLLALVNQKDIGGV